jgi:hypothetical protein
VNNCGAAAANILVVGSDNVKVLKNNTGNAQLNIYYEGNKGEVTNNTIFQSRVFDGIDLIGNQNHANANSIFNSDEAAVYVAGDRNDVNGNMINETPVGVLIDATSTNTHVGGNQYYNTGMETAPFTFGPSTTALVIGGDHIRRRPGSTQQSPNRRRLSRISDPRAHKDRDIASLAPLRLYNYA